MGIHENLTSTMVSFAFLAITEEKLLAVYLLIPQHVTYIRLNDRPT